MTNAPPLVDAFDRPRLGRWRRIARILALVHMWGALAVAVILVAEVVLTQSSDDPATDPHGYVLIFGVFFGAVLLVGALWFGLSARAIRAGGKGGVWTYAVGAALVCLFGISLGQAGSVIAFVFVVLGFAQVYVVVRALREP